MIEFIKGYLCFWDINAPCIWKGEPDKEDREGVVKYTWGSADYCRFTKKQVQEWNELGKWQSISGRWRPVEDFIDHHNMLCAEEDCAIGDTPQEALRLFLLMIIEKNEKNLDYYIRKNHRFYYLNDYIEDKDKWNEMTKDVDKFYVWTNSLYGAREEKMWEIGF